MWLPPIWLSQIQSLPEAGISSPPKGCPPNSLPPSGHSSGPDSALSSCSRQKGGWEQLGRLLERPVLTLSSISDPILSVLQIYSLTGPWKTHPKVRDMGLLVCVW